MIKSAKLFIIACAVAMMAACTTVPADSSVAPNQQAINATTLSYQSLSQAILAADKSVKAGVLKGNDARRALAAFTTAKASLDAALVALEAAQASASGVAK